MFLLYLVLICSQGLKAQEWTLAKEKNGVKVYTKETQDSPIKAFKATKFFNSKSTEILEVLRDVDNYKKWYDRCISSELLSGGEEPIQYYIQVSVPFPFDNRDIVNEMIVKQYPDSVRVRFSKIDGILSEKKGVVRMPLSFGSWLLKEKKDGTTYVEHEYVGDPAGSIPSSVVNLFLVSGPINTLTHLEEYVSSH